MKALIILQYYNRPKTVVYNSLRSIIKAHQNYQDWELAIIDDGSDMSIEEITYDMLGHLGNTIRYYNTHMSVEDKVKRGGSMFGAFINKAIKDSSADFGIMLSDDDALEEMSLYNISSILRQNPKLLFFYGDIIPYDPSIAPFDNHKSHLTEEQTEEILGVKIWDKPTAANIIWRLSCNKEYNINFVAPWTKGIDHEFICAMKRKKIVCKYIPCIVQYVSLSKNRLSDIYKISDKDPRVYTTPKE